MSQVKPIEQIKTGNVNVKTGEEEDEIYDSIYMKIVELVEKDNISCGFYKDTANKLKDLYVIEKRSEQQDTPDQSSQIKLLQEQIRKQEEEVYRLREALEQIATMKRSSGEDFVYPFNRCYHIASNALESK